MSFLTSVEAYLIRFRHWVIVENGLNQACIASFIVECGLNQVCHARFIVECGLKSGM